MEVPGCKTRRSSTQPGDYGGLSTTAHFDLISALELRILTGFHRNHRRQSTCEMGSDT